MAIDTEKLHEVVGIKLSYQKEKKGGTTIKIERFLLDLYSLKKYKTPYPDSREKVNDDIRQISVKLETLVTREIKLMLISELVSESIKSRAIKLQEEYPKKPKEGGK